METEDHQANFVANYNTVSSICHFTVMLQ